MLRGMAPCRGAGISIGHFHAVRGGFLEDTMDHTNEEMLVALDDTELETVNGGEVGAVARAAASTCGCVNGAFSGAQTARSLYE